MQRRPTLLSSCARAATSAEARFRVDYPDPTTRASRIIALDEDAAGIVHHLTDQHWRGGHFLVFEATVPVNGSGSSVDAMLRTTDGDRVLLSDELADADIAVMIATSAAEAAPASVIGDACAVRMVMSAGMVVSKADDVGHVVSALRPNAMVLVVLKDEKDVPAMLTALRV